MQYRQLGTSDLNLPVVTFGAWAIGGWMWGGTDDAKAVDAIRAAIDSGITAIDTAAIYGFGHSEKVVGEAIKGRRDDVLVLTKCGLRWDLEEGEFYFDSQTNDGKPVSVYRNLKAHSIKTEVDNSLQRLGVDVIDLYQCHWPDSTTPLAETMEALEDIKKAGKIRWYGVSNFTPGMLDECLKHGSIVSDQPPYNPLRRDIESDVLPFCRDHTLGVLAYSPLAQGLMTGKVTMDREFPEGDVRRGAPWFKPENRKRVLDMLEKLTPMAEAHDCTLAQLTIAWVNAQPGMTAALVGARDPKQASENAKAGDIVLTEDEERRFRDAVEALGGPA
jgi:aryl-alcohol dehydrogenase-like predicted oxidoreductase